MGKSITVFTTTYNRAYVLPQLYESLLQQTSKDFIWLIIDDGSSDNTRPIVQKWIDEKRIEINYVYKENGGMHTGHNLAYSHIDTELNICIDSDDYMPNNSVEIIIDFWNKNRDEKYAGILGLDVYKNGDLVSSKKFPENIKSGKYFELKAKYSLVGDIKFVYRTEVIRKYPPYPVFSGENFVPLGYKYLLIDQDYDMLFLNEPLCVVEYMDDGSSKNIFRQYFRNPKGFIHERKIRMVKSFTLKERFMNATHFVSTSIYLKDYSFLRNSPNKLLTLFAIPSGIMLLIYLKFTSKKGVIS